MRNDLGFSDGSFECDNCGMRVFQVKRVRQPNGYDRLLCRTCTPKDKQ